VSESLPTASRSKRPLTIMAATVAPMTREAFGQSHPASMQPGALRQRHKGARFRAKAGHYARQQFHAAASSAPNGRPLGAAFTTFDRCPW
jgi:hypothetical protein